MLVECGKMHLQRAGNISGLSQKAFDADAIERHRHINILACSGEIGEFAAEAKPDTAGLARAFFSRA